MGKQMWKEHSVESDWEAAAFLPYPGARAFGEMAGFNGFGANPMAQIGVQWVQGCKAWLGYSRQAIDLWRTLIRDQQDAFFDGLADELERSAPHSEPQDALKEAEAPAADLVSRRTELATT